MPGLLCAVPIKPFGSGKRRLAAAVPQPRRSELARSIAARVVGACRAAGVSVAVVTGSPEVALWAAALGIEVLPEPDGGGLDGAAAAAAAAAAARGLPYAIVHADLPLLDESDVRAVADAVERRGAALAPSRDGGTSVLAAPIPLPFAYGPGSFRRHLTAAARLRPAILVRPGLCIDLDRPADVHGVLGLPGTGWIGDVLGHRTVPAGDSGGSCDS